MNQQWNTAKYHISEGDAGGASVMHRLQEGSAAVTVLKNGISPDALRGLATEISRRRYQATISSYSNGALTTFGPYLARHIAQPGVYFDAANSNSELFEGQAIDLRCEVRRLVRKFLGLAELDVAVEPDGRTYAPAIVRVHGDGVSNPLHNDNIMRDAAGSGLILSQLRRQFSCVTCVQECDSGGELLHYRKRWQPGDERFKVANGLGYHEAIIEEADVCSFRPESGDIYLLDPTNYHAIRAVKGQDRITMGFFFGFFDEELRHGICWS